LEIYVPLFIGETLQHEPADQLAHNKILPHSITPDDDIDFSSTISFELMI